MTICFISSLVKHPTAYIIPTGEEYCSLRAFYHGRYETNRCCITSLSHSMTTGIPEFSYIIHPVTSFIQPFRDSQHTVSADVIAHCVLIDLNPKPRKSPSLAESLLLI